MRLEATTTARPIAMPRETASPWIANVIAPVLCLLLRRLRAVAMRQRPGPARVALLRSPSASAAEAHHWPSPNLSLDRKSTRLNSSHLVISYAVFCLKKKNIKRIGALRQQQRVQQS